MFHPSQMLCMKLFRNKIFIALSNIILCQAKGIKAIISSDLISGSVSDGNQSKFKHKNTKNLRF